MTYDNDKERGQIANKGEKKRLNFWVNPLVLKSILKAGPMIAKILQLVIELIKTLKM